MNLSRFDALGPPGLDREALGHVVARLTLRLRVTGRAQGGVLGLCHHVPVTAHERGVVLQERDRQQPLQIALAMAGCALSPIPLGLVLVTREALGHWRQRGTTRIDHTRVARHALPANAVERQVEVVIDRDLPVLSHWFDREHRSRGVLVAMAVVAEGRRGHRP